MTISSSKGEPGDLFVQYSRGENGLFDVYMQYWSEEGQYTPVDTFSINRASIVRTVFHHIRQNKPKRVFVEIGDKQHKISSQTLKSIIDGKMESADITVE